MTIVSARTHTSMHTPTGAMMEVGDEIVLLRNAQKICGAGLIFAAVGVWIVGGTSWAPDLALVKLLLSLAMGLAGIALLQEGRMNAIPEVEIDLIRREVRLLQKDKRGTALVSRHRFEELGAVQDLGTLLRLTGPDGAVLAEVATDHPQTGKSLRAALRDAGKLS